MRYGLPYKGSKNAIAKWIIDNLPKADTFCDLFFGGGAVTHVGLLSGKYKHFIINDIDARLPKLFLECAYGKHTVDTHPEWISREEFFRRKDKDAYIALVWSFGNNGKDYIYGADIEPFKHDYHRAVYEDDTGLLEPWGYKISSSHFEGVYDRYIEFNRQIKKIARSDLESIQRQIEIERLQSLQSYGTDYRQVPIPKDALIYCDIPYFGTNCGKYDGFNHADFYAWAEQQDNIFISEYWMPDMFVPIARISKTVLSASNGNSNVALEKIYTNRRTYERMEKVYMTEQINLFDYMEEA